LSLNIELLSSFYMEHTMSLNMELLSSFYMDHIVTEYRVTQ
jgi:hypothetical protein